jgi:dihydroflavonol-4-reductase
MARRVAITGATGFIGRQLAHALVERGDRVVAIVRPDSPGLRAGPFPDGVETAQAALRSPELAASFTGADAVVHLAGVISARRRATYAAVNVEGTRAAAEAARDAGAHFVYVSSLAAAGPAPASSPRTEDDRPAPINDYGATKLGGEREVAGVPGLRWTTLRPGVVYGNGDHALTPLFRMARSRVMPVVGGAETAYTFVHIDDMVRALVAAIDRRADRLTCFVGHAEAVRARTLVKAVRDAADGRAALLPIPAPLVWIGAQACELAGAAVGRELLLSRRRYAEMYAPGFVCRVDRLRTELGVVAAVNLEDGLKRSAGWYLRDAHHGHSSRG